MPMRAATVGDLLRERGFRLTPQRRAIVAEILARADHFHAEDLCATLRAKGISRATVYRTLPLLVDCGVLERPYRDERKECYELVYGVIHHDHLVCVECGKVIEFRDDRLEEIQRTVCRRRRFRARDHRLVVRGLCSRCAARVKRGKVG